MRKISTAVVIGAALLLSVPTFVSAKQANQPKGGFWTDKAGNMSVAGWASWRLNRENAQGVGTFAAKASGSNKLVGTWKAQGLKLTTGAIEGSFKRTGNSYALSTAKMLEGIDVLVTRASANTSSNQNQTAHVTGSEATFTAAENKLVVTGDIDIDQNDPGSGQNMSISGKSATIFLSAQGSRTNAVKSAVLDGPVTMVMKGMREADDDSKKKVPFTINGRANRMEFVDSERAITLTGNVRITGDDPSLGGEIGNVNKAIIHLTDDGAVDSVEMFGDPGKTVVTDKTGGGGRKRK